MCTVDRIAVLKILLHSAKYPSSAVNGVLLGTSSADAPSQASESSTHVGQPTVHVTDAIPLLHSFLTLAPSMETALLQVSPSRLDTKSIQESVMIQKHRFNDITTALVLDLCLICEYRWTSCARAELA